LWLAGGLGPDTVGEVMRELSPELVDASSGLEESPGCKDRAKLENYFREIDRYAHV
jgi:indole-3-glycerol phosphate synthase/phosphoribosylanthranilate isomerase